MKSNVTPILKVHYKKAPLIGQDMYPGRTMDWDIYPKTNTRDGYPGRSVLVNNTAYKKKAKQIASQMEKENFREELVNTIEG